MFSFGISCMEVTLVPLKVEFHFFQLKDNFEMSFWLIKSGLQLPCTLFFFPSPKHRVTGHAVSAGAPSPPPDCVGGPHSLHLVVLSPIRRQGALECSPLRPSCLEAQLRALLLAAATFPWQPRASNFGRPVRLRYRGKVRTTCGRGAGGGGADGGWVRIFTL